MRRYAGLFPTKRHFFLPDLNERPPFRINSLHVDGRPLAGYVSVMSFAQLKDQAIQLPPAEQRQLIACLIAAQTDCNKAFKDQLASKIDDGNADNWVELDQLNARLPD